jgi:hypothetical protein
MPADIAACYDELKLDKPSSISSFLGQMEKRKPKEVIRDKRGYYLERRVFDSLEAKYGQRAVAVQVEQLLRELPAKVPNLVERTFLDETIICYRYKAFRAAIVMAWNLAYDHLCEYVLNDATRLAAFNAQLPRSYPKARISAITKKDDFADLKESEVIQVCRSSNLISNDVYKILNEKLGKRNTYAHPSGVTIVPHTAEEVILDLVNNVVLKLV